MGVMACASIEFAMDFGRNMNHDKKNGKKFQPCSVLLFANVVVDPDPLAASQSTHSHPALNPEGM